MIPPIISTDMAMALVQPIKVVKPSQESAIIPDRRAMLLKRIDDAQSELGRMSKLLNEIRADVLHLTTE